MKNWFRSTSTHDFLLLFFSFFFYSYRMVAPRMVLIWMWPRLGRKDTQEKVPITNRKRLWNELGVYFDFYSFTGIVVSILDDGIQTNHPDLAQNYVSIKEIIFIFLLSWSHRWDGTLWFFFCSLNGLESIKKRRKFII